MRGLPPRDPRAELIEARRPAAVLVHLRERPLRLLRAQLHTTHAAARAELLRCQPPVAPRAAVDLHELGPQVVEVAQVLEQQAELAPVDEAVAVAICGLVRAHQGLAVVHGGPETLHRDVDLGEAECAVAVAVHLLEQRVPLLLARHRQQARGLRLHCGAALVSSHAGSCAPSTTNRP